MSRPTAPARQRSPSTDDGTGDGRRRALESPGSAAVRLVARSEVRRSMLSLLATALLVAVVAAAALTSAAGARRTSTVLDRYLAAAAAPDLEVLAYWPALVADADAMSALADELAALDGVIEAVPAQAFVTFGAPGQNYLRAVRTGPDTRYLDVSRAPLVAGRDVDPASDAEVVVSEQTAASLGLELGDTLVVPTPSTETWAAVQLGGGAEMRFDGPTFELEVVGIARVATDLRTAGQSPVSYATASPALSERLGDGTPTAGVFSLRLHDDFDVADAVAVVAAAEMELGGTGWVTAETAVEELGPVRRGFDTLAIALALFAGIALLAGTFSLVQVLSRQLGSSRTVVRSAHELGMSRRSTTAAIALPTLGTVAIGTLVGVAAAIALSPRFPLFAARRAEPSPNVQFDPTVHVGGGLALAGGLGLLVLWSARRQVAKVVDGHSARSVGGAESRPGLARRTPRWSTWLSPPAEIGWSSVLDGARRRRAFTPSSAIAGIGLAVAGVLALAVFTASHRAATDEPERSGFAWDVNVAILEDPAPTLAALADDDRVAATAQLTCWYSQLTGVPAGELPVCALVPRSGSMAPVISQGRAPGGPAEATLAARTARSLGVNVGDSVVLEEGSRSREFRVVGLHLSPVAHTGPGNGVLVTLDGLAAFLGATVAPDGSLDIGSDRRLLITFADGVDPDAARNELAAELGAFLADPLHDHRPPELITLIGAIRPILVALGAFLAGLGTLGLIHYLTLSVSRGRREAAVLASLGFTRAQLRAVVTWQASAVVAIGVVIGMPLGLLVGRWTWLMTVDDVGMIDTPVTPWAPMAVIIVTTLAAAVTIAAVFGWFAARRPLAAALRSE